MNMKYNLSCILHILSSRYVFDAWDVWCYVSGFHVIKADHKNSLKDKFLIFSTINAYDVLPKSEEKID